MSLELVDVTRRYGTQLALERLSIRVRDGDLYGFLGHNGAGKTTAMRIALGLVRPTSGRILVDGFDAREHPKEARARLGGLIEVPGFHGHLDGRTNLELLARVQGLGRREARVESERLLELVGLAKAGSKSVQAFSHGMRQRLGIAQALMGSPRCVLLDEPMNGLDPEGIAEVREILRRAAREGTTVLFSTHQLHEVEGLCNRVGVLYRGRLVIESDTASLFATARGRHRIDSDEPTRIAEWLAARGLSSRVVEARVEFDLGELRPSDLLRDLVRAELPIRAFAPRPASLEEIYLSHTRAAREGAGNEAPAPTAEPTVSAPKEHRAPGHGVWRVARYEWTRLFAARSVGLLIALPALVAVAAILRRRQELTESVSRVENAELFSATDVTAFEAVARGLSVGLPLFALALAGLASQSLSSELARNTLRNLLLRPLRRIEVASGKALALLGFGALGFAVLAGAALATGAACFDFADASELLPNGERFVLVRADELWPELRRALALSFPPLVAYGALGFLAGALLRGAATALALGFGGFLFLDLARAFARPWHVEAWLPSAYLPSPLGDTSFVRTFSDLSQGVSNASFEYAQGAWSVPSLWIVACFLLSTWILSRRQVS